MATSRFDFTRNLLQKKVDAIKVKKKKLNEKFNEDPFTEVSELRMKAIALIDEHRGKPTTKEFTDFFATASAKEKQLNKRISQKLDPTFYQKELAQIDKVEDQIRELYSAMDCLRF
jgi:hypothetical protein